MHVLYFSLLSLSGSHGGSGCCSAGVGCYHSGLDLHPHHQKKKKERCSDAWHGV